MFVLLLKCLNRPVCLFIQQRTSKMVGGSDLTKSQECQILSVFLSFVMQWVLFTRKRVQQKVKVKCRKQWVLLAKYVEWRESDFVLDGRRWMRWIGDPAGDDQLWDLTENGASWRCVEICIARDVYWIFRCHCGWMQLSGETSSQMRHWGVAAGIRV